MRLGELIKQYRTDNRMSLVDFSKRCGLSKSYISYLEHGKRDGKEEYIHPSMDAYRRVATGMNLSLDALLNMVDDETTDTGVPSVAAVRWTPEERKQIDAYCRYLLWLRDNA